MRAAPRFRSRFVIFCCLTFCSLVATSASVGAGAGNGPSFSSPPTLDRAIPGKTASVVASPSGASPIVLTCQWQQAGSAARPAAWVDIDGATQCSDYLIPAELRGVWIRAAVTATNRDGSNNAATRAYRVGGDLIAYGSFDLHKIDTKARGPVTSLSGIKDNGRISPDGQMVAFERSANRLVPTDIWVVASDDSWQKQLTETGVAESYPTFSPDGNFIAYQAATSNGREIKTISLRSLDTVTLVSDSKIAHDKGPSLPVWSRTGDWIYFVAKNSQPFIKKRPRINGTPVGPFSYQKGSDGGPCPYNATASDWWQERYCWYVQEVWKVNAVSGVVSQVTDTPPPANEDDWSWVLKKRGIGPLRLRLSGSQLDYWNTTDGVWTVVDLSTGAETHGSMTTTYWWVWREDGEKIFKECPDYKICISYPDGSEQSVWASGVNNDVEDYGYLDPNPTRRPPGERKQLVIDVIVPPDANGQVPPEPAEGEPYRPWQGDEVAVVVSGEPNALPASTTVNLHWGQRDGYLGEDLTAITDSEGRANFSIDIGDETQYDLTASVEDPANIEDATALIEARRLPLVFLPGSQGSYLGLGDLQIWPNIDEIIWDDDDDSLNMLQMDADGKSIAPLNLMPGLGFDGIIGKLDISMYPDEHFYDPAMTFLTDYGYPYISNNTFDDSQRVFPLAYDWRASASHNATVLSEKIATISSLTGAPRVTVIAHSQGGLVLRAALANETTVSKIHRAATLGTPYLGAPKFMTIAKLGWPCLREIAGYCLINQDRARTLSVNFPGSNDLLPSKAYVSTARRSPVLIDSGLADWPGVPGTGFLDELEYQSFLGWVTDRIYPANLHLTSQALDSHSSLDPQNTGKVLRIVGSQKGTIGSAYLWSENAKECYGTWPFKVCKKVRKISSMPIWVDGDGTVPLDSAIGLARDGLVEVYAGVSHMAIASDAAPLVSAMLYLRFGHNPAYYPRMNTLRATTAGLDADQSVDLRGTEVQVLGKAKGRILNSQGEILGTPLAGDPEEVETFASDAFVDTGSGLSYFLDTAGDYQGKWIAREDGDIVLRQNANLNGTITSTMVSMPFHVAKDATFSLMLPVAGELLPATIEIDDDSDGLVDRTVSFSDPVSGDAASDRTPPTLEIDVKRVRTWNGAVAKVTVEAADGESGIAGIEYRIPETGVKGIYTTPITVADEGEIFVRAVDKAGNWSDEEMASLDDHPDSANLVEHFREANFRTQGRIGYDGDVDLFGLKARDARYSLKLTWGRHLDYDLRVFDASGELVATGVRKGRHSEKIKIKLEPGNYYIAVSAKAGELDKRRPYRLNVSRDRSTKHGSKRCSFRTPGRNHGFSGSHRCLAR